MTQTPAANASWFNFTAQSGDFGVYAFSGFEEVCKPYEFGIELVSRSANVDLTALLGTPACLSIADRSGGERLVHGLIREMEQLITKGFHKEETEQLKHYLDRIMENIGVAEDCCGRRCKSGAKEQKNHNI